MNSFIINLLTLDLKRLSFFIILCLFIKPNNAEANLNASKDSIKSQNIVFQIFPSGGFSPETRIGLGFYAVTLLHFYPNDSLSRASVIDLGTIYTQNDQFYALPSWKIFSKHNKFVLSGDGVFQYYTEKYFGIGNNSPASAEETYRHSLSRIDTKLQREIGRKFYFGLHYMSEEMYNVSAIGAPGPISRGEVLGAKGGLASGAGFAFSLDTRNRIMMTSKGSYLDVQNAWYSKQLFGDYNFHALTLDFRKYLSLNQNNVLAGQFYGHQIIGAAPFRMLSLLGGPMIMRGYYFGRYRDNDLLAAQLELRTKLSNRFYSNFFIGAGEVTPQLNQFDWKELRPNYGLGLRYVYNKRERLNFRLDLGFGTNGNYGTYITAGEAF